MGHYLTVHNMVPLGVLFWCPSDLRGTILLRGTLFRINMIIKEKECLSKKRVLFYAMVPQGYCFGTLFSECTVQSVQPAASVYWNYTASILQRPCISVWDDIIIRMAYLLSTENNNCEFIKKL